MMAAWSRFVVASVFLATLVGPVVSCSPNQNGMTTSQRVLIMCEAWTSVFSRINVRDKLGMASRYEIDAIDRALPVLNPVCLSDSLSSGFDVAAAESALVSVLSSMDPVVGQGNGR